LNFCEKTKVPVLGIVENMGSFQSSLSAMSFFDKEGKDETESVMKELKEKCPHVLDMFATSRLFQGNAQNGTQDMAAQYSVPYWGTLPLDSALLKACEEGKAFVTACPSSPAAKILTGFAERLTKGLPVDMGDKA